MTAQSLVVDLSTHPVQPLVETASRQMIILSTIRNGPASPVPVAEAQLSFRSHQSDATDVEAIMTLPEPSYQNSAGRLLSVLRALARASGQKIPILEVVPNMFGIAGNSPVEQNQACMTGLMEIHKLYLEFQQDMVDIKMTEEQRAAILSPLSNLQRLIYHPNLNVVFPEMTEIEEAMLNVCATHIAQQPSLQEGDIAAIRESITSLRTLVEDAKISPSLREVLLELIRLSEDAISRYNIHGARGLHKAFKSMLGEVAAAYGVAPDESESEKPETSAA